MSAQGQASRRAVVEALELIIRDAAQLSKQQTDNAMGNVEVSQQGLAKELQQLDDEMDQITRVLETVTLDPDTSARMEDTRASLKRTKRKLTTIRGRLGRLRIFEESDRLRLMERKLTETNFISQMLRGSDADEDADAS